MLINEEIGLLLKINTEKEIELILKYNNTKNNISINADLKEIVNEIKKLKEENEILKSEINQLKNYHENSNKNNPNNIKLSSNIINDSVSTVSLSNSFIVFKSINNILYLIYGNKNKSIICYNLNEKRKIQELKNYHNEIISFFQHYLDEINKRDLLMSASHKDNNIRIFNLNNWQCILNLNNINKEGNLFSACFLNKDNNIYIITSNSNTSKNGISEPIKVFDFHGKKINEINNSNEITLFIDSYYDTILSKYFIVTGNINFSQSYDFEKDDIYHKYYDNNNKYKNFSIIIKNYEGIIRLIQSCTDGFIRIFNFHAGLLINKIKISNQELYGMCLWNDNYLAVGSEDKTIKIIEMKNGLIVNCLTGHNSEVIAIKKIFHNEYGECLLSQDLGKSKIKIWYK